MFGYSKQIWNLHTCRTDMGRGIVPLDKNLNEKTVIIHELYHLDQNIGVE